MMEMLFGGAISRNVIGKQGTREDMDTIFVMDPIVVKDRENGFPEKPLSRRWIWSSHRGRLRIWERYFI